MNIFDIGIILFIIMSMIVCAKKGLIKSAVSLVGIILVFIIALTFKEQLGNFLCKYLPFFNFSGNLEGLVSSFQANWSGEAQTAYIAFFTDAIASLKSYLEEFDIIAQNLNTAADYYEKHEETYTNCLGF